MSVHYVDSSAWAKLLVEEPDSAGVEAWVDARLDAGDTLVSSHLLVTELYRLAQRTGAPATAVTDVVSVLALSLPSAATYRTAGVLPGALRSLDALHLATALELGVDDVVTFDRRQAEAAASVGLHALTPS